MGSLETTAHEVIERFLPPVCSRPATLLALPATILSDNQCFKASLSLALGVAIILFAGVIKLPQIATILSNKSVVGLSGTTFLVETFGYTYNLAAHYRQNYPLSTYGDFFVLILENYAILYLFYKYTNRTSFGILVIAAYAMGLAFLCSPFFPVEIIRLMTLGNVAVVVLGRTPQVYASYVNGSTGALSVITCWGIFLGALARIFTTLQDVDSFNILAGYLSSALLNGTIAFQVLYYNYIKKPTVTAEEKVKKAE
eukprot:GFKZ01002674.1.p1 GENE.GFKZ01002674.1~~GFKZ01002674.1.p1  ORF type:complete len:255 (-),score=33.36 GFKZ01002674.1:388-1152(-)